jgi:uncharacterized protein YceH (UPF0502 family)
MNTAEYLEWKRGLPLYQKQLVNVAARYHANVTTEMLDQALAVTKQMQINHNQLEVRVSELEHNIAELQHRVTTLEQGHSLYANSLEVP